MESRWSYRVSHDYGIQFIITFSSEISHITFHFEGLSVHIITLVLKATEVSVNMTAREN